MSDNQWDGTSYYLAGIGGWGPGMDPEKERGRAMHEAALRLCRETPGDVLPEPGARWRRVLDRNAKRVRDGGR